LISAEEIRNVIAKEKDISLEAIESIVKEVDSNGDKEISFEEFKTMMRKYAA